MRGKQVGAQPPNSIVTPVNAGPLMPPLTTVPAPGPVPAPAPAGPGSATPSPVTTPSVVPAPLGQ
jgi:hypothetical protein